MGIQFSSSGSWFAAQKTFSQQANKVLLKARVYNFYNLSVDVVTHIFDGEILPLLMYGTEVWGFHPSTNIHRIHDNFLKDILHLDTKVPNMVARGEIVRHSLTVNQHVKIMKYWLRLLYQRENSLVNMSFLNQYKLPEKGKDCWALNVKILLFSRGFQSVWIEQGVEHIPQFIARFQQRCIDIDH